MNFSKIGIFAFATLAAISAAQAGISGSIVDESGAPIHNAAVTVRTLPKLIANARTLSNDKGAFSLGNAKKGQSIVVRKTGFLPETLSVVPGKNNYGSITLKRDPIENRIDSIMAKMTLDDMIAQMTQAKAPAVKCGNSICGSALEGGGAYTADFYANAWKQKIPVTYGKDNVHGVADVNNATIFPHNIGLGATRDSALVRKIGQAVAEEMWAAHIDLNFAPAITVPQDERWGRVYEGFGETTELAVDLGAAFVRGQQGNNNDAEWRVITTLKHFIGDGATDNGYDRGNATMTDKVLRQKYLPPYEAGIEQGALSVMASFNQVNGIHQHVDSAKITGILKTELAFDGYVIADWEGIESSTTPGAAGDYSPGLVTGISSKDAIKNAINAGLDMAMVPQSAESFVSSMKELVASGAISEERVKDASSQRTSAVQSTANLPAKLCKRASSFSRIKRFSRSRLQTRFLSPAATPTTPAYNAAHGHKAGKAPWKTSPAQHLSRQALTKLQMAHALPPPKKQRQSSMLSVKFRMPNGSATTAAMTSTTKSSPRKPKPTCHSIAPTATSHKLKNGKKQVTKWPSYSSPAAHSPSPRSSTPPTHSSSHGSPEAKVLALRMYSLAKSSPRANSRTLGPKTPSKSRSTLAMGKRDSTRTDSG